MGLALILAAAVLVAAALIASRIDRRNKARRLQEATTRRRLAIAESALRRIANGSADPALEASLALDSTELDH